MGPVGHAPRRSKCSVRIVAIRAFHESLIHAVFEGHRELGLYGRMAAVTQIGFPVRKQRSVRSGLVDGVARSAANAGASVLRMSNASPAKVGGVAGQTTLREFLDGMRRRRKDSSPGRLLDVIARGTVTTFAARPRLVIECPSPEMRVLGELPALVRMASLADVTTNERRGLCNGARPRQKDNRGQYTHSHA
jgi:hypothetical protein